MNYKYSEGSHVWIQLFLSIHQESVNYKNEKAV